MSVEAPARSGLRWACGRCAADLGIAAEPRVCPRCGWEVRWEEGLWRLPAADGNPVRAGEDVPAVDPDEWRGREPAGLGWRQVARVMDRASAFYNGAWFCLLPWPEAARVLLLEAGLGGAALSLAPRAAELWVCHPAPDRARVAAARARRAGHGHVRVLAGNWGTRLPFADGSFDAVLAQDLPSVLAGCAASGPEALFAELRRVLSPSGFLYTEGRARGPLSPRREDSLLWGRWRGALAAAGLDVRAEWLFRLDGEGRPYEVQDARGSLPLGERMKRKALSPIRTLRRALLCASSEAAFAPSPAEGVLRRLPVADAAVRKAAETLYLGSFDTCRVQTEHLVVRIPLGPAGEERCRRNSAALRELEGLSLPFETPRPAGEGVCRGLPYFAETRLEGRPVPYLALSPSDRDRIRGRAQGLLEALYRGTRRRVRLDESRVKELFADPLTAMASELDAEAAALAREAADGLLRRLPGQEWDLVRTHGDFKASNFLTDPAGRLRGLVDWDLSRPSGLPVMDMILCEAFDRSLSQRAFFGEAVFEAGFGARPCREGLGLELRRYVEDEARWRLTALMALVDYFLNYLHAPSRRAGDRRRLFSEWVTAACRRTMEAVA